MHIFFFNFSNNFRVFQTMSVLYYVVRACSLLYSTIDRKQKDFI